MDDEVETLAVDVRANTQGFAQDIAAMKQSLDATLVDGFARAGDTLERGLLGALKKGSLSFEDLRRIATRVFDDIAAQALDALGLTERDFETCRHVTVTGARRPMRVPLLDADISGGGDEHGPYVRVVFELPRGAFATVVLREIMKN